MLIRNSFIYLSNNSLLNRAARKYGLKMGAQSVVAGTTLEEIIRTIREMNSHGISCTVDHLGEFVNDKQEALQAKENILEVIEAIHSESLDAHISLKPSQLGLDIDCRMAYTNVRELTERADQYNIFVNVDMEDHSRLAQSFELVEEIGKEFSNIGTVIQAYFFEAEEYLKTSKDRRMRIVKGAYKESETVAHQNKKDIDDNYIRLIEHHLLHGKFTSIATHDHNIIDHVIEFVRTRNIPKDTFEFQMLYGFRKDLQTELVSEGYNFCTYLPYGEDWFGYFMRRLAERPQNINLVLKQVMDKKTKAFVSISLFAFLLGWSTRTTTLALGNQKQ